MVQGAGSFKQKSHMTAFVGKEWLHWHCAGPHLGVGSNGEAIRENGLTLLCHCEGIRYHYNRLCEAVPNPGRSSFCGS